MRKKSKVNISNRNRRLNYLIEIGIQSIDGSLIIPTNVKSVMIFFFRSFKYRSKFILDELLEVLYKKSIGFITKTSVKSTKIYYSITVSTDR
jgi:hypothetical protein